jgi:SWIM zinc finger
MAARARRERTVRLLCPPGDDGVGVFSISEGTKESYYTFREVPCDIGGRGFALHRMGLGPLYHVRVGTARDYSCECLGFLRHGRCKHLAALITLVETGQV